MKVAVCLVVKDEEAELPYWIAWHKAVGFDSFIIYNDFSEDATEAVILSLQDGLDIRYHRNAVNRDKHDIRQVRAYNDAVARYGSEFDWIALFDADEYLDLYGKDIKAYLAERGDDISLVSFNWCCAGTNGFISRPAGPPFLNYTRHGRNDLRWNRHTKVVFRPGHLSGPIYYVHNVPVTGISVDSEGSEVAWTNEHGGFIADSPTWAGGRLLHYQSRSLEHYVKRDRNLEEIRRNTEDPLNAVLNNPEYNAVETGLNPLYIEKFRHWMGVIVRLQAYYMARTIRSVSTSFLEQTKTICGAPAVAIFDPSYRPALHELNHGWISFHKTAGNIFHDQFNGNDDKFVVFHIKNSFGKYLSTRSGELTATEADSSPVSALYVRGSHYVHLFSTEGEGLAINGDPRALPVKTYKVWANSNGTLSFSHPRTGRYMFFSPEGSMGVDKMRAFAWEYFTPLVVNHEKCESWLTDAGDYLARVDSAEAFKRACDENDVHGGLLFNALTALDDATRRAVSFIVRGFAGEHIL
ncbi:glycosyltransferase family 2 protein [Acidomonas methanolica]|uniref:glycosyltransferase family 2 protein n=1 Tax=Acidomonas methanolica TaxID=437 RepID=UPI002119CA6E|nr:glycosyltransferase family 2 protein [Acidomonas methanolica]MCQ9154883.1 glycosyltransferase family 2 protein [Acidomonas methanolica]